MTDITTPIVHGPSRFVDVARVLEEAEDPSVLLAERLRLLGEAGSILEDALRLETAVRVAIRRTGKGKKTLARLESSCSEALLLQERMDEIWCERILKKLARLDFRFPALRDLDTFSRSWLRTYFEQHVVDGIRVWIVDGPDAFPSLDDGCYLVATSRVAPVARALATPFPLAVASIPAPSPDRMVVLPDVGEGRTVMWLDDVIRLNLDRLVGNFLPGKAYAVRQATIRAGDVNRDPGGIARKRIARILDDDGESIRILEYDRSIPYPVMRSIQHLLDLGDEQLISVGRYPAFGDLAGLASAVQKSSSRLTRLSAVAD